MNPRNTRRAIMQLRYAFLGLFAIGAAATWTWQIYWVEPGKKCEAAHHWWDWTSRTCAMPVSISTFTHRPVPASAPPP